MSETLDRLARLCGIQPDYRDIRGNLHVVSDGTKRALLEAMGVPAAGDAAVGTSLRAREERPWRRPVEALTVARDDRPVHVVLRVPERRLREAVEWRLEREDGTVCEGALLPADRPGTGRREVDGEALVSVELALPAPPPCGDHVLRIRPGGASEAEGRLVVVPGTAYLPPGLGPVWGLAVQLYGLRSRHDQGIGTFGALRRLVDVAAEAGAAFVGLSPLHALFSSRPDRPSPYSPSSRGHLHVLHLDVEAIPELAASEEARALVAEPSFRERLAALRAAELVDHEGVAALLRPVHEALFREFRRCHLGGGSERGRAFRAFRQAGGPELQGFALFEALQERFALEKPDRAGWPAWPAECRDPRSEAVGRFARERADRVERYLYLQWCAEEQLAAAGEHARERLAVGLYHDLAVGVNPDGFETWWYGGLHARGVRVGAPPDDLGPEGQDWGLPPMIPDRLRDLAHEPFRRTLRAVMRHAGAVRIDHVMGLHRLFWIPPGRPATEGAYVHYPADEMFGLLALESQRHRCLVVGEDLGTVPDEVRWTMAERGLLGIRLLYFEREADGSFRPPRAYPRSTLVAVTTHDLPTLAGWWGARDIRWREALGLLPDAGAPERQEAERTEARRGLLRAFAKEGLWPAGAPGADGPCSPEIVTAAHRFLARSPSTMLAVQLEDVLGGVEQANLPGTTDGHPNWRRRLPLEVEVLADDPRFTALAAALRVERARGGSSGR